jgi:hypothetical protein
MRRSIFTRCRSPRRDIFPVVERKVEEGTAMAGVDADGAEKRGWLVTHRRLWFAVAVVILIIIAAGGSIWWTAEPSPCWHPGMARNVGIAEICP